MYLKVSEILKAAFISAAFLFCLSAKADKASFEDAKKKVGELILQNKKTSAVHLLASYINSEPDPKLKSEASELASELAKKFVLKESQEAYENSLNLTLENENEAGKLNDKCLSLEPEQVECLIQKLRLQLRNKNEKEAIKTAKSLKELVPGSKIQNWVSVLLLKSKEDFKNSIIIKNIPQKAGENEIGLILVELDRAFLAKNYSRAKDILNFFEKNYVDWPDLVYYKNKLNTESAEEAKGLSNKTDVEPMIVYKNKCKSLSKTAARKFRYDIELCIRGN